MRSPAHISLLLACFVVTAVAVPIASAQHAHGGAGHSGEAHTPDPITSAVLPLPEAMRDNATVLGYDDDEKVSVLRQGTNEMYCLGDKPGDDRFQAVCYHKSLEPFMARGRELRAQGVSGKDVLEKRHQEMDQGLLEAPSQGAVLYNMMMDLKDFNPETATPALYAIYTPGATEETTGLSSQPPAPGAPWIMRAGTPSAHIMIVIPGKHDH